MNIIIPSTNDNFPSRFTSWVTLRRITMATKIVIAEKPMLVTVITGSNMYGIKNANTDERNIPIESGIINVFIAHSNQFQAGLFFVIIFYSFRV